METRAVAGSAYKNNPMDTLTHAVVIINRVEQVLCNRVKLENLLDDTFATDPNALPTCPVCRRKVGA